MKKLIVANWKCNPTTLIEAKELFSIFRKLKAIICPPFIYLNAGHKIRKKKYELGAQDCHWEQSGAFTGNVSPKMLKNLGCKYVILGHSERRKYFNETDEIINKKIKAALKARLKPILCVGEKKGEKVEKIVKNQLDKDLKGINKINLKKITIAYEPIWAIGTGNFCSAEKANKVREFIRKQSKNKILYGGSVNSKIANDYTKIGFNGLLVGGASLKTKEFIRIVKNA
jgi:triosephosphate isomerase